MKKCEVEKILWLKYAALSVKNPAVDYRQAYGFHHP